MAFIAVLSTIPVQSGEPSGQFLSVVAICVCLCLGFALMGLRRLRDRRDLFMLRDAARQISRGKPAPKRLRFHMSLIEEVWRIVLAMAVRARTAERAKETYGEVLSASSHLTQASDKISTTAEELSQLLFRKAGTGLRATAVVLRDPSSNELTLEAISGLPKKRSSTALLIGFQSLFDAEEQAEWGYELSNEHSLFNLSSLDVGLSLTVPLRNTKGLCGGIWMGFREGASTLSPQRKAFLKALAEHAAASFYAARKVEEQKKKNESEKDFLLGMSHDLRAPGVSALYAIRDLLSGELGILTEEQHLRLTIIEQALEDQLDIVGDVLDYTKHQKGFLSANNQTVDLRTLLQKIFDVFSLNADRSNLTVEMSEIPSVSVVFDPRHLQRIVSNFLSNAIKYTDQGTIAVNFRRKSSHLEIIISDTGIGIPEHESKLLFSEFRRLENSENRPGCGLGLALSKVLAELNKGYVFYEPKPNKGSVFGVGIPLESSKEKQIFTNESLEIGTLLVVDDHPNAVRTNIRYLQGFAHTVVPASNVGEAIKLALNIRPDLIVTDLWLGNESVARLLATIAKQNQNPPVLIVTGSSETKDLDDLKAKYRISVLEKPVDRSTLTRAVVDLFRHESSLHTNAA